MKGNNMKSLAVLVVIAFCLLGCTKPKSTPVVTSVATQPIQEVQSHAEMTMQSVEAEPIAHWRTVAHSKGLRWKILCTQNPRSPNEMFWGYAWPDGTEETGYIEDGAKPYWDAFGRSQEAVATKLYALTQGPPNQFPEHRPKWKLPEKECPLPLHGN
jgi:hypothetical protein